MDLSDVRGASSPCVAVWLLGPFRVVRSGVDAALAPSRKVRALVAYLVMARRPVHRAKLCELFWDASNDPRGELRWCLCKIRGLLSDPSHERVKTENDWVSVDASTIEVDALWVAARGAVATSSDDLDLLKQLAAKFEGEFLEGFEADCIPLFETWLIGERQRFQSLHADVLSRIITLLRQPTRRFPTFASGSTSCPTTWQGIGICSRRLRLVDASRKARPIWRRRPASSGARD